MPQPPVSGQYWANTALLPVPDWPWTVTFQPLPSPVVSETKKLLIVALVVCERALSVTVARAGRVGAVAKLSDPWAAIAVAYIGAAYFFTSSTGFANPAISIGRMFSDAFAGVAPASAPTFIAAQLVGETCAIHAIRVLYPDVTLADAAQVVLSHHEGWARWRASCSSVCITPGALR